MHSAESLSKEGEKFGKTSAFRAISQVRRREQSWLCFDFIIQRGCVWLCWPWVTSVECGDHEERDRRGWCRSLQSSSSAEEKKRFLLQRSWQQLQSVWGQWVSNLWHWISFLIFHKDILYLLFVDAVSLSITDNISTDGCPAERQWESFSTGIQNGTSSGRTSRTITLYLTVSQSSGFISFDPEDLMLYNRWAMTCRGVMFLNTRGQRRANSKSNS